MSKKKSFQVPTTFIHTVSESNLGPKIDRYSITANRAYVDLSDASMNVVSIPTRVFRKLVQFFNQEAEPNLK